MKTLKSFKIFESGLGEMDFDPSIEGTQEAGKIRAAKRDLEKDSEVERIKEEAKRISKEEGVVQHVNKEGNTYQISDWYDEDSTIASYENGRSIS